MPFDWMHPTLPEAVRRRFPERRKAMHVAEIEERAALLQRLRWPRAHAERRCLANLAWDFEVVGTPPVETTEVQALVEAVYRRSRRGQAGGKGRRRR